MRRGRRGIALLATLAAIALLGVLAVASSRLAVARMAGARRIRGVHDAALETGRLLDSALAAWPSRERARMAVGQRDVLAVPGGRDFLAVTRLSPTLYRLDAATHRGDSVAPTRHAAALLVRTLRPRLDPRAPLLAGADATIGADFVVSTATAPACDASPAVADVLAADSIRVRWEDADRAGTVIQDASLQLDRIGPFAVAELRELADLVLAHGATLVPVPDSARLVYAAGDLTLGAGAGQGMIVVAGDLTITGPLTFTGAILVLGATSATTGDLRLEGALHSRGPIHLTVPGSLRHDPCSVDSASALATKAVPVPWWSMVPIR